MFNSLGDLVRHSGVDPDGSPAPRPSPFSRLRMKGGRWVMNLALFTYFIPAAFLAVADVQDDGHVRPFEQRTGR